MIKKAFKNFLALEASTGILLAFATLSAVFLANSASYDAYQNLILTNLSLSSFYNDGFTIRDGINDGLMTIFFLLVGMELKKEVLTGELSSKSKIALPLIAACGGVIVPALIFYCFNHKILSNLKGFAIPTATDIAFAYAIISLFGKKISSSLKIFLVALAVIDDLMAILIIAIFYSQKISLVYLGLAVLVIIALFLLRTRNYNKISLYLILGFFLWLVILKSGVHATLAGVILALFIPFKIHNEKLLEKLAHKITPIVNLLILPVFAFANAGVRIENFSPEIFFDELVIGVILGLFFGKQLGVMLFSFLAIKFKITNLPNGANWLEFYAASIFTGIGFTMSLFIGSLAFVGDDYMMNEVRIGVFFGSLLSIIYGLGIAYYATNNISRKSI